ncbi:hypothetical protein Vadar_016052 [Vaccinium darrowii]|uniref:Uncharacterized protein n=1 Tax=Vaccinium darrowii TaxID=229202 RepID=A0ACB7ZC50_9ERIC|nr:hypothetical protein Vadar_016052 [Vaccinium darrowii]
MAVSPSNTILPFKSHLHNSPLQSQTQLSLPLSIQKSQLTVFRKLNLTTRSLSTPHVLSKSNDSSSSSTVTEPVKDEPKRILSDCWREFHGENDWAELLEYPMDPLFRSELIRYGEMAQACYDAFNVDPFSKYCGSCRFTRREFLTRLGMESSGYEITRYLYAKVNVNLPHFFKKSRSKGWSENANWFGYVAVSNEERSAVLGRRDITIAWRGTGTNPELLEDLKGFFRQIPSDNIPCPDPTVKVESGFLDFYTDKNNFGFVKCSAREQILSEVKRLMEIYRNEEVSVTITGHSLGSALAILSGYDIVDKGINAMGDSRVVPVCVYSFSGPRVGNVRFKEKVKELGLKVLRVVNVHDLVPKLPLCYSHVGVELELDHKNSPFLRPADGDEFCAHNLEAHLHLLDGYYGKDNPHGRGHDRFILSTGRDTALVNKSCDFLKDYLDVPPNWRQEENKGMVKGEDGRWIHS